MCNFSIVILRDHLFIYFYLFFFAISTLVIKTIYTHLSWKFDRKTSRLYQAYLARY